MGQEIDLLQFPHVTRTLGTRTEEHRAIARRFDKEFFDGSRDTGYGGYVYDGRWVAVAQRLKRHYGLRRGARVLDIGCAKGFLVHDFVNEGLNAWGLDVSGYALAHAYGHKTARQLTHRLMHRSAVDIPLLKYDLIVSINSLHNLPRDELATTLKKISERSKHAYITMDAYRNDDERARMEAWNLTAKTIMHVDEWVAFFAECGYTGDYSWFMP